MALLELRDPQEQANEGPISASGTATGTNSEYAHTWVTYDEAIKATDKHGYNGVGFKIPQGYFFLDIDHKELTDPFVQLMLERFNSYSEYSVSGAPGFRAVVHALPPFPQN